MCFVFDESSGIEGILSLIAGYVRGARALIINQYHKLYGFLLLLLLLLHLVGHWLLPEAGPF